MKYVLILFFLLFSQQLSASSTLIQLNIKGVIGPSSSEYLKNGIEIALNKNAKMILVTLDTPGGLSTSMREMIQKITNSPIPVIMYVFPKGARAASAGTYLLYASHVAAMAPGTNLGAATPVNLMPTANKKDSNSHVTTLEKKAINDAMAYIKSLAQLNDRNISWALDAVKKSKSLSAKDALAYKVIDIMADNIQELLEKLDGRVVKVSGKNITLHTKGILIIKYEPDWKTKLLSIITNPNIVYIFILIAIYGIFFELMHPGGILPGVFGSISGVIALYALNIIPFNYAGLLLIILGIGFMILEVFVSGFGVLGIGGVLSFAFGSVLLFDADTLGNSVSIPLVIAFSLVTLGFFLMVMKLFLSSRSAKIVTGIEDMVGSSAKVIEANEKAYHVLCHSEIWNAQSEYELVVGQEVKVVALLGLVLKVKPIKE